MTHGLIHKLKLQKFNVTVENNMYEIHTTREGDTMLIAQMEDSHLINLIKRVTKRMSENRLTLTNKIEFEGSELLSILNSDYSHKRVVEEVTRMIQNDDSYIQPYIVEACLRGLDVSSYLQKAYGRSSMIATYSKFLKSSDDEFEDSDDYDDAYDY